MPITVIATQKVAGSTGGTTPAFNSTGANCIAVWLAYGGSPTVTDNQGNTYTAETPRTNTVAGRWYYCLYATVGGSHTVTIGGGSTVSSCVVYALAGVATTAAYSSPGGTDIASGTAASFGAAFTPPEDNCIVLMGAGLTTPTITGVTGANGWTIDQWTSGVGGTNYGSVVGYKIQTTATQVPISQQFATWTNSAAGVCVPAIFKAAPAGGSLTISTPAAFEVHQRSGTTGSIQITGSVSGSTEDIEASFNGGAYVTIATAVAPGSFSGTLTGQAQGMGTLTVRKKVTIAESATVANVGIGDVFVVGGDSISEGRGTNAQNFGGSINAACFRQDNLWKIGNDAVDTGTSIGSHWPILARRIMDDQSVPVAFISVGTGSTDVAGSNNQWAKPNSSYGQLTTQVTNSTVASVRGVLMHLGPNAVVNATTLSKATYNAAIDTLAANLAADVVSAPKLHLGIFGEVSTGSPPDRVAALNNLRGAIIEATNDNANVLPGPCLIELDYADGVHPQSDAALQAVANRWWVALKASLYGGSGGRGPRLSSAVWNLARTELTVTFDRALKTGLSHATQPWAISDNGSAMTITGVAYGGGANDLVITTSVAATGPAGTSTLTFAGGDTAVGRVVPMSADITLPGSAGVTQIPAEPIYTAAVGEFGSPVITTNPNSQTVSSGAAASFVASATGTPTPTVQWERSTNGGGSWSPVSGATSATYAPTTTVTGGIANNGDQFRAVFSNTGGTATTTAAVLTVNAASAIGRPASDTSNSGWTPSTGTELYAMLDEVTPNPADYIVATTLGATCELALSDTTYPGSATQTVSFRASSSTGNSVIVRLKNTAGAAVRSQTQVLTATDTLYSFTLTAGEVAAITSGALSVILESA